MRRYLSSAVLGMLAAASVGLASPSREADQSYQIDCAILLCLAGGFPASAECSAAKIELIRRITPWPIEPPLQLWRCPMGMSSIQFQQINTLLDATDQPLMTVPEIGADGLTPDARRYRDGISVYHVRYMQHQSSGGLEITDNTLRGDYDEAGQFRWVPASLENAPKWLAEGLGGQRTPIRQCVESQRMGRDDDYCIRYETVRYSFTPPTSVRAVAIRTMDHQGNYSVDLVRY